MNNQTTTETGHSEAVQNFIDWFERADSVDRDADTLVSNNLTHMGAIITIAAAKLDLDDFSTVFDEVAVNLQGQRPTYMQWLEALALILKIIRDTHEFGVFSSATDYQKKDIEMVRDRIDLCDMDAIRAVEKAILALNRIYWGDL